jgi:nucleotide-binding universal stress UspA family protein
LNSSCAASSEEFKLNNFKKRKGREVSMFYKILYPTDFSDVSKKALGYLVQLKDAGAKEIVILHVIDEKGIDAIYRYGSGSALEIIGRIEKEAREEGKKIEKKLRQSGLEVKVRIETGVPLKEILKVEEEEKVSAIVIGSHGKTNLEEMFLGSVSEKVIRQSKNPVLIVKR